MRMQVAAGLGVDEADDGAVADEPGFRRLVVRFFAAVWVEEPVVVGILVVVAGNLLLCGALGVRLHVRVQEPAAVSHVLDCRPRAVGDFQRAALPDLGALEVRLEERAHLGIARAGLRQDGKVHGEAEHVDEKREDDEPHDSRGYMGAEFDLASWLAMSSRRGGGHRHSRAAS